MATKAKVQQVKDSVKDGDSSDSPDDPDAKATVISPGDDSKKA